MAKGKRTTPVIPPAQPVKQTAAQKELTEIKQRAQEKYGDIEIHVDLSGLLWGDMMLLVNYNGQLNADMMALLDRVVVGGIKDLPFWVTAPGIMDKVMSEFNRLQQGEGGPDGGN